MTFPDQDRCTACGKAASGFVTFRGQRLGMDHADCRRKVATSIPQRRRGLELEVRTVSLADFEIRSSSDGAGTFEGYANKFGVVDTYETRFQPAAWSKGGLDGETYPLLWMHDPWNPIGTLRGSEDSTGLQVEGRWDNSDEGKRARERAESGSAPELSVGFRTVARDDKDSKLITAAELREVSQITKRWGSSPGAEIASVRFGGAVDQRAIEGSYENLQQDLRDALQAQFGGGLDSSLWVIATFPDRVIYSVGWDSDNAWQVSYTQLDDESFSFGMPVAVEVAQVVQPRSQPTTGVELRRRAAAELLQLTRLRKTS